MKKFLEPLLKAFALLSIVLLARPTAGAEPGMVFRCVGPLDRNASHAGLERAFGRNKVGQEEIFAGGDTETMTVVFADDPRRKLLVGWRDQANRRGLARVTIEGRSRWSVGGLAVGSPLVAVERLNGRAFKLNDYEGDFGGDVIDWMGGHLEKLPDGCVLGATLAIDEAHAGALMKEVARPDGLLSSHETLRAANPVVSRLFVSFPK